MARSFGSLLNQMAREAARAQRRSEAARRRQAQDLARAQRDAERRARAAERDAIRGAKLARQEYLQDRERETQEMNQEIAERLAALAGVLEATLSVNDAIDFDSLRISKSFREFRPPPELIPNNTPPRLSDFQSRVVKPSWLGKLLPSANAKMAKALQAAEDEFDAAMAAFNREEVRKSRALQEMKVEFEERRLQHLEKVRQRDEEVDSFRDSYHSRKPDAILAYCAMVLERSEYPEDFPHEFRLAYVPESSELVVEYQLPGPEAVPAVVEYRFVKSKDLIEEKPRKIGDVNSIYQDLVAAVALRTIHEVFEADSAGAISIVTFNGFVCAVDRATGKDIRPHLISVRATKHTFMGLNLARVDRKVCLRNLGAQVSPRPGEIQAVKPIVEFDMVDRRFVEESDVLSDLEARPNIFELSPFEFENLVANLFAQMGLEARLTRSSRDGGVDVVAFDARPVLGGKVVIQAKRWKNTVGVSAARDLYGTMQHEGANKGILVTTSGFGPDAFEFSKDKPIELIDGGRLLYLLDQVGTKARIVFPEEGV